MKAIRIHRRGGPEQLVVEDVPIPSLVEGDVLVRVCAAGVTPTELQWDATYVTREGTDRLPATPGHELSGVVEATTDCGDGLTEGEAVYGLLDFWHDGDFAEFVAARPEHLAPKPRNVDHVHAAAAAMSGLAAWQGLFDQAHLTAGQRVLIHGAAGGVGSFAVQLANWRGAEVIATAAPAHRNFVYGLGASEVVDYTTVRFEDVVSGVDAFLDTVGGETLDRSWKTLRPGGVGVTLAGTVDAAATAQRGVRGVSFIVKPSRSDLTSIARLLDAGTLRSVVTEVLPLDCAKEAFSRGLNGHNRGKTVLSIDSNQPA